MTRKLSTKQIINHSLPEPSSGDYNPDTEWLKVPAHRVGQGDVQLWAAVVGQAAKDIAFDVTSLKEGGGLRKEAEDAKRAAINWLHTEDFYEVCEMAGLHFPSVLGHFKELLTQHRDNVNHGVINNVERGLVC